MNKLDNSQRTIQLRESLRGTSIMIEITKGENYSSHMESGPFIFNVLPQIAIWTEDNSGNLIDTLYVTGAQFKTFTHAEKDKKQDTFFKEFLPVWSSRVLKAGLLLPSKKNPYPDSITSATPTYSFTLETKVQDLVLPFTLYLEINRSVDYNQTFTQKNSDSAGQPSVIYRAEITEMKPGSAINMKVIGQGHGQYSPCFLYLCFFLKLMKTLKKHCWIFFPWFLLSALGLLAFTSFLVVNIFPFIGMLVIIIPAMVYVMNHVVTWKQG